MGNFSDQCQERECAAPDHHGLTTQVHSAASKSSREGTMQRRSSLELQAV